MNTEIILQYFLEYLTEKKSLELKSYQLFEEPDHSKIELALRDDGKDIVIDGAGVGMIDAGFNSLINHFSKHYLSLNTIKLEDVYFQVDHRSDKDLSLKSKTEIKLEFSNHCRDRTWFSGKTSSMGYTGVSVLVSAIEFYMNCELLFKRVKFLLEDAENRSRHDIASTYKYVLTRVVEVTNYQTIT